MRFELAEAMAILARTPGVLRAMLGGLDQRWVASNYGPDTFSPFDVLGHLIHGEKTDWIPRARAILAHGAAQPFEPFDRYAMYAANRGRPIAELLDEFESLRAASLDALRALHLTDSDLDRPGLHPALGPVTMRQLLAMWPVHDLNHIAQICKAMAWQYGDEVGPWRAYVSILPREEAAPKNAKPTH